ncbi:MAG: T9SS type A sorting domain-containing protein [Bacteroidota bacterium]
MRLPFISYPLLIILLSPVILYGQTFSCSNISGFHQLQITNPSATDGDDGNIDGNCEYEISFLIFSFTEPIFFTYTGDNIAVPNSVAVTNTVNPLPQMTITAPCGDLDISFDLTDADGNDICVIRNVFMPVELVSFQAQSLESGVLLSWKTASEINNIGFEVERSTDSKTWNKIAFVEGHLTTLITQQYEFTDTESLNDLVYYRLKQLDTDGRFEYSNIIAVKNQKEHQLHIFPNPATDYLFIGIPQEKQYQEIEMWVFNQLGQLIKYRKSNSSQLNVSDLQKGFYNLVLEVESRVYVDYFVKG